MRALEEFDAQGWIKFSHDPMVANWVRHAAPIAEELVRDQVKKQALRCGGTWCVGVNLLPNDPDGQLGGGPALKGRAMDFIKHKYGHVAPLDRAQISVIYPGYPRSSDTESAAAFVFRQKRDAAHVDGLLPVGPNRRRQLMEPHAFVLGIPLNFSRESPMVVWEGSHHIIASAFRAAFDGIPPSAWADHDITEIYHAARRSCFEQCTRRSVIARPGEAYVVHRCTLHGVAPWGDTASEAGACRSIAYFRPELADIAVWPN
ncbi:hypothetical protein [Litoreibacter roseus]|uniref:Phytanoyl-CoA dioxygenase (PhyH) n=1 Tax=Litoreibacter roseus TaxID=2601869 RepID=A0A6N6JFB0_9RHOB|nr:hypothetical protein [Litoreibacter roseus]GFE63902.1 hypothetical protein KIN_09760 [Litoreibacter roseus]